MAKPKNLKFKPYVGNFFKFVDKVHENPKAAIIGEALYGNSIKKRISIEDIDQLPNSVLVVEEKRNNVKFLDADNKYFWTTKAQIEPLELPEHEGSPLPMLKKYKEFLIYCTNTKISDFSIEKMTKMAIDLLPEINSLIEKNEIKIV